MSTNDTPETDAEQKRLTMWDSLVRRIEGWVKFARTLERERDEARAREARLLKCLAHLRERDWFTDPGIFGTVTCGLDAEDVRDALRSEVEG